jgi:ribonuclease HI
VECDPEKQGFRGAKAPTNNTGELTAIIEQCEYLRRTTPNTEIVEIQTDSTLAMLAALGANPRKKKAGRAVKNETLRHKARECYKRLQKHLQYKVRIRKIKAHAGHEWNEVADELAAIGRELNFLRDGHMPHTAELRDRLQRAIDGEGANAVPDIYVRGFRWG